MWASITSSNLCQFQDTFRSVLTWSFNFAGNILGTNNFGTFLNTAGAFSGILNSLASLVALQQIMKEFQAGNNPLGDIIAGSKVGSLALELTSDLLSAVNDVTNLNTRYIHLGLNIDLSTSSGIPTGFSASTSMSVDQLYTPTPPPSSPPPPPPSSGPF